MQYGAYGQQYCGMQQPYATAAQPVPRVHPTMQPTMQPYQSVATGAYGPPTGAYQVAHPVPV